MTRVPGEQRHGGAGRPAGEGTRWTSRVGAPALGWCVAPDQARSSSRPSRGCEPHLQQVRGDGLSERSGTDVEANLLRAAAAAGVPVPGVVAAGAADGCPAAAGGRAPRGGDHSPSHLWRRFAGARAALNRPGGRPPWPPSTPSTRRRPRSPRRRIRCAPARVSRWRWCGTAGPRTGRAMAGPPFGPHMGRPVVVHGDFRMGNLLIDDTGLRWRARLELAHLGDPAEDIGWLCARSWRSVAGPGGRFGELDAFLDTYTAAGGDRWTTSGSGGGRRTPPSNGGLICLLQASAHLSGATRSVDARRHRAAASARANGPPRPDGVDRPQEDGTSHEDGPGRCR